MKYSSRVHADTQTPTLLPVCVVGGAAVPSGPAVESRVRGAAAALPAEPGTGQRAHAGHVRAPPQQVRRPRCPYNEKRV